MFGSRCSDHDSGSGGLWVSSLERIPGRLGILPREDADGAKLIARDDGRGGRRRIMWDVQGLKKKEISMHSKNRGARTGLVLVLMLATAGITGAAVAQAPAVDAACTGSLTMSFSPPVAFLLPPATGPFTVVGGTGTITTCVALDNGPSTGTFAYQLAGNLTCTSAGTATGTLNIEWADHSGSHVELTNLLLGFTSVG